MKKINSVLMPKIATVEEILEQESQKNFLERFNLSKKIKKGKIVGLAVLGLISGVVVTPLIANAVQPHWPIGSMNGWSTINTNSRQVHHVNSTLSGHSFVQMPTRFQVRTRGPNNTATAWSSLTLTNPSQRLTSATLSYTRITSGRRTFTGNFEFTLPQSQNVWINAGSRTFNID